MIVEVLWVRSYLRAVHFMHSRFTAYKAIRFALTL